MKWSDGPKRTDSEATLSGQVASNSLLPIRGIVGTRDAVPKPVSVLSVFMFSRVDADSAQCL